jgi:hypothetical protein
MSTTQTLGTDWRYDIAETARPILDAHGVGAVIVGSGPNGPEVVSRSYSRDDYANSNILQAVAWGQATRYFNEGGGFNFYVVNRYDTGATVVWNGRHCILVTVDGEA